MESELAVVQQAEQQAAADERQVLPVGVRPSAPPVRYRDFGPEETSAIERCLQQYLSPDYVAFRPSPGSGGSGQVAYLEGYRAFQLANETFGFDGWNTEVKANDVDFLDFNAKDGKWSAGIAVTCRILLKNGSFHEDVGYGTADNMPKKGMALEKARKEAVTDAAKRALRQFGNSLGNCLYDKEYVKAVEARNKVQPVDKTRAQRIVANEDQQQLRSDRDPQGPVRVLQLQRSSHQHQQHQQHQQQHHHHPYQRPPVVSKGPPQPHPSPAPSTGLASPMHALHIVGDQPAAAASSASASQQQALPDYDENDDGGIADDDLDFSLLPADPAGEYQRRQF